MMVVVLLSLSRLGGRDSRFMLPIQWIDPRYLLIPTCLYLLQKPIYLPYITLPCLTQDTPLTIQGKTDLLTNALRTHSGVAVGSAVGHTLSNAVGSLFGGSSAAAPAEQAAAAAANNSSWGNNCAGATQSFTKCMDENSGNMQICGWYLEQLVRITILSERVVKLC